MRSIARTLAFLLTALSPALLPAQEHHTAPHWAYLGEADPAHWSDLDSSYATCGLGHTQSPIDIQGAVKMDPQPIQFDYHASPLTITDNGHTIMMAYAPGSSITVGGHPYMLKQLHFHHPGEEKVNGHAAAMVVHLVHADAAGKLAVVAVPLEAGAANPMVAALWEHLPAEKNVAREEKSVSANAADLLPANHSYFTFAGSLTTPPCTEEVTWFVLETPVTLSKGELEAFAKIYPMNARPVQPLNGRPIRESR